MSDNFFEALAKTAALALAGEEAKARKRLVNALIVNALIGGG